MKKMKKIKKALAVMVCTALLSSLMGVNAFAAAPTTTLDNDFYVQKLWSYSSTQPGSTDVATFKIEKNSFEHATDATLSRAGASMPGPDFTTFEVKGDDASVIKDGESGSYTNLKTIFNDAWSSFSGSLPGKYSYVLSEEPTVQSTAPVTWQIGGEKYRITFVYDGTKVTQITTQQIAPIVDEAKLDPSHQDGSVSFKNTNTNEKIFTRLLVTKAVISDKGTAPADATFKFKFSKMPDGKNYEAEIREMNGEKPATTDAIIRTNVVKNNEFTLKANQYLVIYNLENGDELAVDEATPAADKFVETYYKVAGQDYKKMTAKEGTLGLTSRTIALDDSNNQDLSVDATDGDAIHFLNVYNEDGEIDAGLTMNIVPFIGMMAVAMLLVVGYSIVKARTRKAS